MKKLVTVLATTLSTIIPLNSYACEPSLPPINQHMNYKQARAVITTHGWYKDMTTWQEATSSDFDFRAKEYWNRGYNEVKVCSGTGYGFCNFKFIDAYGNTLTITTIGQASPGKKEPEDLSISGWSIKTKAEAEVENE